MRASRHFAVAAFLSLAFAAASDAQQPNISPTPVRSPTVAQLAAQSNLWIPFSERIEATPGLWGDAEICLRSRTWQEHCMSCREILSWLFACPPINNGCQTNGTTLSNLLPHWLPWSDH